MMISGENVIVVLKFYSSSALYTDKTVNQMLGYLHVLAISV